MANKHRGRIYWPKCAVCQYEKRNPTIREQILDSTYMSPTGSETLAEVWHRWGDPFNLPTIYSHMRRHRSKVTQEIEIAAPAAAVPIDAIEATVVSNSPHERALDEIIVRGRNMVARGEIKITAQALLQAVKTKAEIEKSTKDRRMDAIKTFFGGTDATRPADGGTSQTEG